MRYIRFNIAYLRNSVSRCRTLGEHRENSRYAEHRVKNDRKIRHKRDYHSGVCLSAVDSYRADKNNCRHTDIEKGVLITTGTFSKSAKEEASNPGKQQIDLIDGEELMNKIAEYGIGVREVIVYEIDEEFFAKI